MVSRVGLCHPLSRLVFRTNDKWEREGRRKSEKTSVRVLYVNGPDRPLVLNPGSDRMIMMMVEYFLVSN